MRPTRSPLIPVSLTAALLGAVALLGSQAAEPQASTGPKGSETSTAGTGSDAARTVTTQTQGTGPAADQGAQPRVRTETGTAHRRAERAWQAEDADLAAEETHLALVERRLDALVDAADAAEADGELAYAAALRARHDAVEARYAGD